MGLENGVGGIRARVGAMIGYLSGCLLFQISRMDGGACGFKSRVLVLERS